MRPTTILALQSLGITLQIVNAGLGTAHADPLVVLLISATVGGFQFFLQHAGNQSDPRPSDSEAMKKSAQAGGNGA